MKLLLKKPRNKMLNMKLVAYFVVVMIVCTSALPQPHKFGFGVPAVAVSEPVAVPVAVSVPRIVPIVQPVVPVIQPYAPIIPYAPIVPVYGRFG